MQPLTNVEGDREAEAGSKGAGSGISKVVGTGKNK